MENDKYKQIVVLSGKGGTGKTTVSSALSAIMAVRIIIDCDVDAANLHLLLNPIQKEAFSFDGGKKAHIDVTKCDRCGLCETVCRFNAIRGYTVDQLSCEGCGFCYRICPSSAISFNKVNTGTYYECSLTGGELFYNAKLKPGAGNSGLLVSRLKKTALEDVLDDVEWVIVDGPPGIGCPVNASVSGADYVIIVTEPSLSGIHDMKRLSELLKTFRINHGIIINKFNLNSEAANQIVAYSELEGITVLGSIPFEPAFVNSLIEGKSVEGINPEIEDLFKKIIWQLKLQLDILNN